MSSDRGRSPFDTGPRERRREAIRLIADLTEQMGYPASAARAIGAFIRFTRNDIDRVVAALDLISASELATTRGIPS